MARSEFEIQISDYERVLFTGRYSGAIELGRQKEDEAGPFSVLRVDGWQRLIVAGKNDKRVSRQHIRLELVDDERLRVANISSKSSIRIDDDERIEAGEQRLLTMPARIMFGEISMTVLLQRDDDLHGQSFSFVGLPQDIVPHELSTHLQSLELEDGEADRREMLGWLAIAMGVLQSAANAPDFLQQAAKAVVDIFHLDRAAVLRLTETGWTIASSHTLRDVKPISSPSSTILTKVQSRRQTLRQLPSDAVAAASLDGVEAVVAAPILDNDGQVTGVVYGDRCVAAAGDRPNISELEAALVEILACGVAAGLCRVEKERAALAAQIQFEQFFSKELATHLRDNPRLLEGRDADISTLFCDIRSFSQISERLGPRETMNWVSAVMDSLSECVFDNGGVVVDYIGDELLAMWGAPNDQNDHPKLAYQAALGMLAAVEELNAVWTKRIGEPIRIGIGISSGMAHVGNTGTRRRFKYGPLGNSVNQASRIQGATKLFRTGLLLAGETWQRIGESHGRRLATVNLLNIKEPIELYDPTKVPLELSRQYSNCLAALESGDLDQARSLAEEMVEAHQNDGPAAVLLGRTRSPDGASAIWALPSK